MKKPSKNDLKLVLLWIFAFSVIIFMITFTSHAETSPTNFPFNTMVQYVVDDNGTNKVINSIYYNYISAVKDDLINGINSDLQSANISYNSYIVCISDIQNVTTNLHGAQPYSKIWCNVYINPYVNSNINISSSFMTTPVSVNYDSYRRYVFFWRPSSSFVFNNQNPLSSGSGSVTLLGNTTFYQFTPFNTSSDTFNTGYYSPNYPIVSYNLVNGVLDTNDNKIIISQVVPSFPIGLAVPPPTPILPDFDGQNEPEKVPPSYTINNYTWNTYNPPTPDFSTLEDAVESLYDLIKYEWGYFRDNLNGEFTNLQANIKGLFEYIGQTIQYYGGLIIDSINNGIETFYNNMVALFEPLVNDLNQLKEDFVEFADLFIHPFDEQEFESQMESCELINQYEQLMDNCEVIQQIFDYAEERDYFVLYIDFENPFADSEHKIIHSQISFNWLVPLRSVYRPFLWTFTLFECFVGGMRILGNIIGGKAK